MEELDARMPMKGTIHDIDAQRARWLRYRTSQRLTIEAGEDFALGGLGRYVDGLDLRLAFLPEDPDADGVTLDSDTLDWLKQRVAQTPLSKSSGLPSDLGACRGCLVGEWTARRDGRAASGSLLRRSSVWPLVARPCAATA